MANRFDNIPDIGTPKKTPTAVTPPPTFIGPPSLKPKVTKTTKPINRFDIIPDIKPVVQTQPAPAPEKKPGLFGKILGGVKNIVSPKPKSGPMVFKIGEGMPQDPQVNLNAQADKIVAMKGDIDQTKPKNQSKAEVDAYNKKIDAYNSELDSYHQNSLAHAGSAQTANVNFQKILRVAAVDQAMRKPTAKDELVSAARMVPRGVAEAVVSVSDAVGGPRTVEPSGMDKISKFLLGDETISSVQKTAADYNDALEKFGIKGKTASGLAVVGAAGNLVMSLLPLLAPAELEAQSLANKLATNSAKVVLSPEELSAISRADFAAADSAPLTDAITNHLVDADGKPLSGSMLENVQRKIVDKFKQLADFASKEGRSITVERAVEPESTTGKIAQAIGGKNQAEPIKIRVGGTPIAEAAGSPAAAAGEVEPRGIVPAGIKNEMPVPAKPSGGIVPDVSLPAEPKIPTAIKPEWIKSDDLTPGILDQLQNAQPGSRTTFEVAGQGGTKETVGTPSTFPDWIPADLRTSAIVKPVAEHLANGTLPTAKKQIELYNHIADMVHAEKLAKDEIDSKVIKNGVIDQGAVDSELDLVNKQISEAMAEEKAAADRIQNNEQKNILPVSESQLPEKIAETKIPAAKTESIFAPEKVRQSQVSETLGFNPKNISDPAAPETGKEIDKNIKRSDIAKQLSDKLNVPIRRGKFRQAGAIGIFKSGPKLIRIKGGGKSGGLPTIFHEVGHFIDDQFDFSKALDPVERRALMVEYGNKYESSAKKQRKEGFAEFLRFKMTGQTERAAALAPKFNKIFESRLKDLPEIKDVLDSAAQDYARWKEMPAAAKVFSQISIGEEGKGPIGERIVNGLHNVYTQAMDDLHPLSEFSTLAKNKGIKLVAQDDPYKLARNLRGWIGRAETFLKHGTFGKTFYEEVNGAVKPKYKGASFESIVKPIELAGNLNDFRTYLVAKRAIELADRNIISGISKADAEAAVKELEAKHPEFAKASTDLYTYQGHLLEYAYENGLIGDIEVNGQRINGLEHIKALNKFRVPFYRVFEEMQNSGKFMGKKIGNASSPIKKIKGSDRDIIDPIESIVKDTYALINAADRNSVAVAMAKLSDKDFELGRLMEKVARPMAATKVEVREVLDAALGKMEEITGQPAPIIPDEIGDMVVNIFRPSMFSAAGDITVIMDGKPVTYHMDADIYKAIQGMDQEDVGTIIRLMSLPAAFLRTGATLSPDFALRNPLRDQFSAFVYSKAGFVPGLDLMRGMFEVWTKGDAYQLWKMAGGEHATLVGVDRPGIQKTLAEVLQSKGQAALSYVKNPLKLLQIVSQFGEQATRLGEMRKVLLKTKNPTEAAFASREVTLDFARIGAKTKAVNHLVAFWNANVQGMDKMLRSFKENPRRTWMKVLLGITLPSILLYLHNRKDPRWKEIPQWQKNIFWIVMTKDHIYRVPKPFELGIIFGSVPERILEWFDNQDDPSQGNIFPGLEKSISDGAAPGFIPTGILPILENMANHSFFLDRPIVSPAKVDLPPEEQFSTYTSESAKKLGQLLGYSPDKIDNLINGYFGGLGQYATDIIDGVLKDTGISNVPSSPTPTFSDIPGLKAFIIRNPIGASSESVNTFYDLYSKATAGATYVRKLIAAGDTAKATKYVQDHPEVANAKLYTSIANAFSDISKAKDAIQSSRTLSPDQKRQKIDELDKTETDIAAKALTITVKTK